jgi:hypothetical protein
MFRTLTVLALVFTAAAASAAPASRPASAADLAHLDARYHFTPAQRVRVAQVLACYQEEVAALDQRCPLTAARRQDLAQQFRVRLQAIK